MNKKYIEREPLIADLELLAKYENGERQQGILGVCETIRNRKTADVIEVRHGKWIEGKRIGLNVLQYTCSECGLWADTKFPYCHCGAKMDGKDDK